MTTNRPTSRTRTATDGCERRTSAGTRPPASSGPCAGRGSPAMIRRVEDAALVRAAAALEGLRPALERLEALLADALRRARELQGDSTLPDAYRGLVIREEEAWAALSRPVATPPPHAGLAGDPPEAATLAVIADRFGLASRRPRPGAPRARSRHRSPVRPDHGLPPGRRDATPPDRGPGTRSPGDESGAPAGPPQPARGAGAAGEGCPRRAGRRSPPPDRPAAGADAARRAARWWRPRSARRKSIPRSPTGARSPSPQHRRHSRRRPWTPTSSAGWLRSPMNPSA